MGGTRCSGAGGTRRGILARAALLLALALGLACSPKRYALNKLADALAATGDSVRTDDDPDLVRDAAPFSLKLYESVLAQAPRHRGLLLAAASGFTQYAYAFVQEEADEAEEADLAKARALRVRARRLYLRARGYGMRGLEVAHPGFEGALARDPAAAAACTAQDVPLLYWTAAAWGSAIALSKDDPGRVAELPQVEALLGRALALDEGFDHGALHTLMITFVTAKPGAAPAASAAEARRHFERAVALSEGRAAGPYVALAEGVAVPVQDRKAFASLIEKALAVDPDAWPDWRLMNLVTQRRARWLAGRADALFIE